MERWEYVGRRGQLVEGAAQHSSSGSPSSIPTSSRPSHTARPSTSVSVASARTPTIE
ncbi:MAG: hypothetical protein R2722_17905 [Tessaracoccus sp.]